MVYLVHILLSTDYILMLNNYATLASPVLISSITQCMREIPLVVFQVKFDCADNSSSHRLWS